MRPWLPIALICVLLVHGAAAQVAPPPAPAPGNANPPRPRMRDPEKVHDPSKIVTIGGVRRFFSTGGGVSLFRENADGKWLPEGRIFAERQFPKWHEELVPGNRGHLWAPDVVQIGDRFFVYYSVSTFGKNISAIGLAVGKSLDPASPDWHWEDRGPVLTSRREDRFNAIDPDLFRDAAGDGSLWMTFGSFWDGIHLVELDRVTGQRLDPAKPPVRLVYAPEIEAPFLHRRGEYYYLFVNWGKCCRGVDSTYEIRVGRSLSIEGPYLDQGGTDMRKGGGTLILESEGRWIGPGHPSIHEEGGSEMLVHHCYDRELGGRSRLRMLPLKWDEQGWPAVEQPK
ncbi:MAG: arabinan endo-1,5-alpha-L-arabinosidase [Chthoniobacteraceae bacterium]